ncbi:ATP-binding protein [Streptomyces triticagri]|uniref:ATP-binding protein n=2 Tax=Streptomyces triticagri TaxID=2293568 RepID=A0A372MBJ9_9ACTN|nr:ATP-binding protein [Streptomyces triticagri]
MIGGVRDRLSQGVGSLLVVEGDSGFGKSTLMRRFAATESGGTCRIVLSRCMPTIGTGSRYAPVWDALTQLSKSPVEPPRRSRLARMLREGTAAAAPELLSVAVPGLGAAFTATRAAAAATVATGSIPGDSLLHADGLATRQLVDVVVQQARDGKPLLLMIDDIQLSDHGTLELLHLLLPRLRDEPLALVLGLGSYGRSASGGQAVHELLAEWERDYGTDSVLRHQVPALPAWAVRQLVTERLRGKAVPERFPDHVFDATAGHPVFVDQVLNLWHPGYGADVPLPEKLPAAIEDRFGRLDPHDRELLVVGATMGEFFCSHTVAEVTGMPQLQVQDRLHAIQRDHGLVTERRRSELPRWTRNLHIDWYDFEHRLLQRTIRRVQQREGARLLRHAGIADALGRLPRAAGSELPRELRVLIADQLRQAGPARAAECAVAHLDLARTAAVEELAFLQAEQHCRTAIDAVRLLPEGTEDHDRRLVEAVELLLSLTEVRWQGGHTDHARPEIDTLAAEAEQAARRLGDRLLIARTTLLRGKTLLAVDGLAPSLAKLEEAVQRARECGDEGITALYVAMVEYGRQLPKRDLKAGLAVLVDAERLYGSAPQLSETGNPVLQHARNLNEMQIGVNLFDAGRFDEARVRLERCVARLDGETPQVELPIALNYLAQLHVAMGAEDKAREALSRALQFEESRGGASGWHAYNSALLALITSRDRTRAREAVALAEEAWQETTCTWLVNLVPIVRNLYVEVLLETGHDPDLAARLARDSLVETERTGMDRSRIAAYCLRSRLRSHAGDIDDAAADARMALSVLEERGDMPALRTEEVLHDAARALHAAGAPHEAQTLWDRARTEIHRKADSMAAPDDRARFLNGVPLNRTLLTHDVPPGHGGAGTVPGQRESRPRA